MPYSDHSSRDSAHRGSESPGYSSCHPGLANGQGAPADSQGYYIFSEIHPEHGPRPTGHVDSEGLDHIHHSTPLDGLVAVQSPTLRTLTGSRNTRDGQSKLEVRVILASVGTIYNSTNFSSYIPSTKTGLLQSISHSLAQSAHCHRQVTRTSIPSPMARWWVFSHSFAEV